MGIKFRRGSYGQREFHFETVLVCQKEIAIKNRSEFDWLLVSLCSQLFLLHSMNDRLVYFCRSSMEVYIISFWTIWGFHVS